MDQAAALRLIRARVAYWVLDPALVQQALREFDREVVLEHHPAAILPTPGRASLDIVWRQGAGVPLGQGSLDRISFILDPNAGIMAQPAISLQWPLPAEFLRLVRASVSDVTPTPQAVTVTPIATPYPTAVPTDLLPRTIFFDHPDGELRWHGPDDRVYTRGTAHCEPPEDLKQAFGIPALIAIEEGPGFWAIRAVLREDGWRWTGYYHDDWQIWQGDDGRTVYLVHAEEPRIAFEYQAYGCI